MTCQILGYPGPFGPHLSTPIRGVGGKGGGRAAVLLILGMLSKSYILKKGSNPYLLQFPDIISVACYLLATLS